MVRCSSPLYLGVIKQQSQLQLVTTSIGQSMDLLEISIIMSGERMVVGLFSLGFCQFRRVYSLLDIYYSLLTIFSVSQQHTF